MKKIRKVTAIFLSAVLASSALAAQVSAAAVTDDVKRQAASERIEAPEYVEGEAIVVMKDGKGASAISSDLSVKKTLSFDSESKELNAVVVTDDKLTTNELISELKKDGDVAYAFPNYKKQISAITDDAYSKYQWALENTGQNGGKKGRDIAPKRLWDAVENSTEESVVAVMDTGIDVFNDELKDNLWINTYEELPGLGKCGYDFTYTIYDGTPYDDNGHGSHVAGIIAASADNGEGISGINKSNVKIMACKIGDSGGDIYMDGELEAFEYIINAKKLGVNIKSVNLSYGGFGDEEQKAFYDEMFDVLGELGIVSCVAAGNESMNVDMVYYPFEEYFDEDEYYDEDDPDGDDFDEEEEEPTPYYILPAASDSKYSVTVAASTESNGIVSFSNYGMNSVDIAAPGTDILSTVSYNCFNPSIYSDSEVNALCAFFNNFNTETKSGFGSFTFENSLIIGDESELPCANSFDMSLTDKSFGADGKALSVKIHGQPIEVFIPIDSDDDWDDEDDGDGYEEESLASLLRMRTTDDDDDDNYDNAGDDIDEDTEDEPDGFYETIPYYCAFETDFTVDDLESEYVISLMAKGCESDFVTYVFDVPADYKDDQDMLMNSFPVMALDGSGDYWDHFSGYSYPEYFDTAANERKLLFIVLSYDKEVELTIDDLAVSCEDPEEKDFGKYDFYNGTSMATPYVTGAVALISNAEPSLTPTEIISLMKDNGRRLDLYASSIQSGNSLYLDKVADKISISASGMPGDINGDGVVDAKDRITLTRYLAKWSGYDSVPEKAADLNLDGTVDAKDRIILTRHLAKWAGYESIPKK